MNKTLNSLYSRPTVGLLYRIPPSNRQHLSCGDCMEGKRGDYLTSSVLLCIIIVHIICTAIAYNEQFIHGRLDQALILLGLAVFRAPVS